MSVKNFIWRVQSSSLKRMRMYVRQIHEESGVPKPLIVSDMLWCILRYGVGYLEYQVFGFVYVRGKKRRTFMTMKDNLALVESVNDKQYDPIFTDKSKFNHRFAAYIGREWLDLRQADLAAFSAFVREKDYIFAKEADGFGGVGVTRVNLKAEPDIPGLYQRLKENRQFVVEERILQHPELDRLCPSSINTIRIVTLAVEGKVHVMYSLIRIGNGKNHVDNISSGGLYCPVDETGVLFKPGFCDKTGAYYEEHPMTKTRLVGFQIPFYDRAVALCKRAALEVPQVGYVGWDVAIRPDGPILVEGNTIPGYDMCQNYYHLREDKTGVLPRFQAVLENGSAKDKPGGKRQVS